MPHCQGLAAAAAERVGGVYFPAMSFGLDEYRPVDQLLAWGFKKDNKVFGMRFPELPLWSEYCNRPEMTAAVENRLEAVAQSGFRFAILVNNHGGTGQIDLLAEIARPAIARTAACFRSRRTSSSRRSTST